MLSYSDEFDVVWVRPCCSALNKWERFLQAKNSRIYDFSSATPQWTLNDLPCGDVYKFDNQADSDITSCKNCVN